MENQDAVELDPATAAAELADPAQEHEKQVVANWQKSEAQTLYLKFAELDLTLIKIAKVVFGVLGLLTLIGCAITFLETKSPIAVAFVFIYVLVFAGLYQLCEVVIRVVEVLKTPPSAMQAPAADSPAAAKSRVGNVRSRPERQRFGAR